MGPRLAIALVSALALGPASAAESPEIVASLAKARRWVKTELRYADAIARLEQVLSSPALNSSQRVEANELLAYAAIALGDAGRAERAFSAILEADPAYRLPTGTSPKIAEIFALTQARRAPPPPPPTPAVRAATVAEAPPILAPPAVEAASESEAWYQKWWVWTILGAAAVGGASTAIALSQRSGAPSGTLGPIRVP